MKQNRESKEREAVAKVKRPAKKENSEKKESWRTREQRMKKKERMIKWKYNLKFSTNERQMSLPDTEDNKGTEISEREELKGPMAEGRKREQKTTMIMIWKVKELKEMIQIRYFLV